MTAWNLPLILKPNGSTPALHALYPQVFSGKGDAHFSFCYFHHMERIQSIDQSKGCKINYIVTLLLVVKLDC